CFIDAAKEESIEEILTLAELKKTAKLKVLVVAGCLAQRYKEAVFEQMPEVDALVGTTAFDAVADAVLTALDGKKNAHILDESRTVDESLRRVLSTGGHYAYLKIAEGCNKFCTYCVIPRIRGRYRSVPMETLLEEAKRLAEDGATELILVAQETTMYGTDLYGEKRLHILLKELAKIPAFVWIRILYCYPEEIYPELLETMASEPKICRYLDLPIQHASDNILRQMHRRTSKAELVSLIENLRRQMPDIVLRTTLIAGFPGETEEDHRENLDFIRQMQFDRLGVFTYSKEDGTPAAKLPGQVHHATKKRRRRELMELQQDISLEKGKLRVGQEMTVVVEGYLPEEGIYTARTYGDVPGVDGYLFFEPKTEHMSGDFVRVRVTGSSEYDLTGEEIEDKE
ncbi:MAG: 30S ribosomal protein S12 methylthiotransferase RimO, partial [bacterium]